jgi:hypothetical protein
MYFSNVSIKLVGRKIVQAIPLRITACSLGLVLGYGWEVVVRWIVGLGRR